MLSEVSPERFGVRSALRGSSDDTHQLIKLLARVVNGASILSWGPVLSLHITICAVLCMLYKIKCKPMHSLYGVLPLQYVPVRVTRTWCFWSATVHLCASSLQNIAVPQYFYSLLSISVEWSWCFSVQWCGEFQWGNNRHCGTVLRGIDLGTNM